MKGKIIALAVSFAVGFTAIFFSVRPQAAFNGKGNGKNAAVNSTEEFATIVENLPRGYEYYALAEDSLDGKAKTNTAEIVRENFHPVTVKDKFTSVEKSSMNSHYDNKTYYKSKEESISMNLTVNFAKDGVYYDVHYTDYAQTENRETTTISVNGRDKTTSEGSVENSYTEYEFSFYVGVRGAYLKYDKYNILKENIEYVNGVKQENNDEDDEEDTKIQNAVINTIKKNYGKWINVLYKPDVDLDKFNPETSEDLELMVQYACVEIGQTLIEAMLGIVDADISTVAKMGNVIKMAETKSNDVFDKKGSVYSMTALGRYMLLTSFGYNPSVSGNDSTDYNSLSAIRDSSFVLDMFDKTSPAWYLDYDYSNSSSGSSSFSMYETKGMHEEIVFTNIDNTVTPKIGSSKTLYAYLGKTLKELLAEAMV